jgi:hypothetical protein
MVWFGRLRLDEGFAVRLGRVGRSEVWSGEVRVSWSGLFRQGVVRLGLEW